MFHPPFSTILTINGYELKMYGVVIFLAIIAAIYTIDTVSKKLLKSVDPDILIDMYPMLIISGIIGARLYYVLLNQDYYFKYPSEILAIWHGGISIHGAILGGLIAGLFYLKRRNLPFLNYADAVSFGLCIGQVIGRWGNFFNQEAFGLPTDLPWKLYIEPMYRPNGYFSESYYHPTFLYESIFCFLIFLILLLIAKKVKNLNSGVIFFSYLTLYSTGRFFIEGLRLDSVLDINGIPIARLVSAVIFILGILGIIFCTKKRPN